MKAIQARQPRYVSKKQIRTGVVLAFPVVIERIEAWTGLNLIEEAGEVLNLDPVQIVAWVIPAIVWVLYVVSTHVPLVDKLLHFGVTSADPDAKHAGAEEVIEMMEAADGRAVRPDPGGDATLPATEARLRDWLNKD